MPKIALVEYFATEKKTILFIVRPEDHEPIVGEINIFEDQLKKCKEKLLGNTEKGILGSFERIDPNNPQRTNIEYFFDLSEELISRFLEHVKGYDILYLVPHGWLHYLPLHALKCDDGKYLIEKYAIVYAPSATILKYCQEKNAARKKEGKLRSNRKCLSFGIGKMDDQDSLKESFYAEAKYVGEEVFHTSGECKIDLEASKEYFIENCKDKEVIHIACHGFFNELQPLKSGLLFSDGKSLPYFKSRDWGRPEISSNFLLTAEEIFSLKLNADLVVLSACVTGVNENRPGDELIGLTRALMYAGTPSVIASLWNSYSDSTLELMRTFYKSWNNPNAPTNKVKALQRAQIEFIRNSSKKAWSHPYHWGLFILIGDWL